MTIWLLCARGVVGRLSSTAVPCECLFGNASGGKIILHILHTNDFHGNLSEASASAIQEKRLGLGENVLLLDAGDAGSSGNLTYRAAGEPILKKMSEIGYDAMTVGNRDFHLSRSGFECKLSQARFPVLCANLHATNAASFLDSSDTAELAERAIGLPVFRYIVRELPECRVVIFGLTVPMITRQMLSRKVSAYLFDAPLKSAQRLVPYLKTRFAPDLLIALTHIGYSRDQELASAVPGIDLIIGGHSHTTLPEGTQIGATRIVQAGSRGSHLGIVEIARDSSGRHIVSGARLEPL